MRSQVENTLGFGLILRAFCAISVENYCARTVDKNVENSRSVINAEINFLLSFHSPNAGPLNALNSDDEKKTISFYLNEKNDSF